MGTEALDDALVVFAATAPNYGSVGLANHGPMVAEALAHLGRSDAIGGWVAGYRARLDEAPHPARPLSEEEWPAALGPPQTSPSEPPPNPVMRLKFPGFRLDVLPSPSGTAPL